MIGRLAHAVVDSLLPGDEDTGLPAASELGVDALLVAALQEPEGLPYHRVISAIARELGGAHEFLHAMPDQRTSALRAVESRMPLEFRALVVFALESYYQSDRVILAMGWRREPPQPLGHDLDPLDETLLDPVRSRALPPRS